MTTIIKLDFTIIELKTFQRYCHYHYNYSDDKNNNNNSNNNNPVVMKYRVGIWRGIAFFHGYVGVSSLGWQPS